MEKPPAAVDLAGLLEGLSPLASASSEDAALREMREIEQFARCRMRMHLRSSEFARTQALAEAAAAAQDILENLPPDTGAPGKPAPTHLTQPDSRTWS